MGMSEIKFQEQIEHLIENRHMIPDEFWVKTDADKYEVLWFMDRQKPSVEANYSFDEERFGLTRDGKVIWGFHSGCSCPSPWSSSDFGDAYETREWKEFVMQDYGKPVQTEENRWSAAEWFDAGWEEECYSNLSDYILLTRGENIDPVEVLNAKNAEVRRYLIKRVGYQNIKDKVSAQVLHTEGDNELLKFGNGEMYVKVKDSSTEREYLLFVEGNHKTVRSAIAWTFGLREEEYNPIIET